MEAAREGERLRTALIDSLTHELRTPLTSIRAAATTLVEGEGLDEAARLDLVDDCGRRSARLDLLIGEAVEMAEIDANVVKVHAVPQHPARAARPGGGGVAAALAAHQRDHRGRGAGYSRRGSIRICWAGFLRHLLENAARYTPPGSRITLRSRRAGRPAGVLRGG